MWLFSTLESSLREASTDEVFPRPQTRNHAQLSAREYRLIKPPRQVSEIFFRAAFLLRQFFVETSKALGIPSNCLR
jgi:hypothetical protein